MNEWIIHQSRAPTTASPQHLYDAGMDLRATAHTRILPGTVTMVETDTQALFYQEYVGLVSLRSGFASRNGVFMLNSPGVIDAGYCGPIKVAVSCVYPEGAILSAGERFAQLVLLKRADLTCYRLHSAELFAEASRHHERGANGFGSTGIF